MYHLRQVYTICLQFHFNLYMLKINIVYFYINISNTRAAQTYMYIHHIWTTCHSYDCPYTLPIPFHVGISLLISALFIYTHSFKEHNSITKQALRVSSWCTVPLYYGVNLDRRMLDKTLCVVDTKFTNLRTHHFTSWLYYFCWNSLTAWWCMPCHLFTAIPTPKVLDWLRHYLLSCDYYASK
jgi:hypothetical protein